MRYYSIKILTATDGAEARDLRGFDTLDEALVRYHSDLQANISKCKSVYCAVINGVGGCVQIRHLERGDCSGGSVMAQMLFD